MDVWSSWMKTSTSKSQRMWGERSSILAQRPGGFLTQGEGSTVVECRVRSVCVRACVRVCVSLADFLLGDSLAGRPAGRSASCGFERLYLNLSRRPRPLSPLLPSYSRTRTHLPAPDAHKDAYARKHTFMLVPLTHTHTYTDGRTHTHT